MSKETITPKYVFDSAILKENYFKMKENLYPCEIHFALKSNSNADVLKVLKDVGSSFECASVNEYELLRKIGVENDRIVFGLPIKTEDIITRVYSGGCRYFVFEDIRELAKLERLAPDAKKVLRLYTVDLIPTNIAYGMPLELIEKYNKEESLLSRIDGLSFHISNNTDVDNMMSMLERAKYVLRSIPDQNGKELILNIGGSYSIDAPSSYYDTIRDGLKDLTGKYNIKLKAEPGMSIVNSAGCFYTRVVMTKEYDVYTDVYIDGGTPNGIFGEPSKVTLVSEAPECKRRFYRFIDITCIHKVLFQKRMNVSIRENDLLRFENMGAYSVVYQNKFHLWDEPLVEMI